jgi:hypothetical protein
MTLRLVCAQRLLAGLRPGAPARAAAGVSLAEATQHLLGRTRESLFPGAGAEPPAGAEQTCSRRRSTWKTPIWPPALIVTHATSPDRPERIALRVSVMSSVPGNADLAK